MTAKRRPLDLLCLGRAGIDLYAEQVGTPLEEVQSFAKYVGGCPANVSVGTRRLGLRSGMLTRVGDDGLGRFVRNFLEAEGVDVAGVRFDPHHLTGLVILGIEPPDRFPLLFYRENCADIHLSSEDVAHSHIGAAGAILVSGTGFSRDPSRRATRHAIELARAAGTRVVLDVDVRPTLWDGYPMQTTHELQQVLPLADLVVGTEEEIAVAGGDPLPGPAAVARVRELCPGLVIVKEGPRGATAYPKGAAPIHVPGFRISVLNTLGAGDGFLSGFLRGWLTDAPLESSLRLGNAVGAIVVTRHGCAPAMPTFEETQTFMKETPTS